VTAVLLVAGYAVAVAVLLRARAVLRERRWRWFIALEVATATVAAGYATAGAPLGVVLNVANIVVFAVAWLLTGPRRSPGSGGRPGSNAEPERGSQ
jgi:hypothetical protein